MKFKTIYVDVIETIKKPSQNNSQNEFIFMELTKVEDTLKQLRMFCDHISYSLFHDINHHPKVKEIYQITHELGFRFDVKISSLKFIEYIDELCQNDAISNVTFCFAALEETNLFENDQNGLLLHDGIKKLMDSFVHVLIDLPSKTPESYQSKTLSFINELGLNLNNNLWQKGFQVNIDQYLMIRCCEQMELMKQLPTKTIGRCYGSVIMLAILGNGNVIPCNHENGRKIVLGNIFEEQLSDILSKEPYVSISDGFYKNELVHPVCQHCPRPRKNF